jgi:hypothetical protein
MTFGIGDNPDDRGGHDFRELASYGITPIARLNYSHHGQGTVSLPHRYPKFAERCRNFVAASQGCAHWVIGNEPNIIVERPQGQVITPEQYARCFGVVQTAIKSVSVNHQVLNAAVAPYNVDSGSWIAYWMEMLSWLEKYGIPDGLNLHTYSRGAGPGSITSENKMDAPYQDLYNGFRAYRDFLAKVQAKMRHLPVYITETDQNVAWEDRNDGWVRAAYTEVDEWNKKPGTQKIYCLALYRWYEDDQWKFQKKRGVVDDFIHTLNSTDFRIIKIDPANAETQFLPAIGGKNVPTATVTAPAGANLRSGPGTSYPIMGASPKSAVLHVIGKNDTGNWWQVDTPEWGRQWVSGSIVSLSGVKDVPQVAVAPPAPPTPAPAQAINREWMLTSWCRILNLDVTVARAILAIESGGRAFEGNRMIIRFENHVFLDNLTKRSPHLISVFHKHFKTGTPRWTGHEWRASENHPWERQHDGGQTEEWQVFNFSRTLDETSAMYSISMGMGQIMGGNHRIVGYDAVQSMFNDYNNAVTGEMNQLTGFFAYLLNVEGMLAAAQRKDWRMIATKYNGSGNENVYGPLLKNKYKELGGRD